MKKNIFVLILLLSLLAPVGWAQAAFNTVRWGTGTRFYLPGVAAESGASQGISIDVYKDSYVDSYTLDTASLKVKMYAGSELHLKSVDKKLFQTDITTAETKCYDNYSTWDYVADKTVTVTISWSDSDNCAVVETTSGSAAIKVSNLHELEKEETVHSFKANDKISFVVENLMEVVTIKSVGAETVTVYLTPLEKEYVLRVGEWNNIDMDGDGYREVSIMLKNINLDGTVDLSFKPVVVVKVDGIQPGDLIKIKNNSAVYYYAEDGKRYVFPNEKVYFSWYDNFNEVKIISEENMAKLPIGGLVTYRPGSKLVTFPTTNDVYVVDKGGVLRKLKDEKMAEELYGQNWTQLVDDINEAFYSSYKFGSPLENLDDYNKEQLRVKVPSISADKNI